MRLRSIPNYIDFLHESNEVFYITLNLIDSARLMKLITFSAMIQDMYLHDRLLKKQITSVADHLEM